MRKIEIIGNSEYFEKFVNRTDIEILQIDIKGCEQSVTFQESFIAVIYYKTL